MLSGDKIEKLEGIYRLAAATEFYPSVSAIIDLHTSLSFITRP